MIKWQMADKRQQDLLDEFYRQEKVWYADYYSYNLAAGIILAVVEMMLIMPFQVWEGDYQAFATCLFLELFGVEMYTRRYCVFREDGKNKSVYGTIRYLPVSHGQLVWYILTKMLKLCLWTTGGALLCQVVFALLFYHAVSAGNLLMPFLCCMVWPMLLNGVTFVCHGSFGG